MKTFESNSLEETKNIAVNWLNSISQNNSFENEEAVIVGLYGNLGSGKTTFTQFIAKALDIKEQITSPTFVIEKIYETKNSTFKRLVHIDAYRLENGSELQNLNFEELVDNKNNLILIEWPENVKDILPKNHLKIYFEFIDDKTRKITFE